MKRLRSVLLIDDDEIDNFIHQDVANTTEISSNVSAFHSAVSALAYLKTLQENMDYLESIIPELVLLDINMPEMNGFEFLEEFEKFEEGFKSQVKFIILSSSDNPDDYVSALKSKRVIQISKKPLTQKVLMNAWKSLNNERLNEFSLSNLNHR